MADIKRISNKNVINNGNVDSNLSMSDILLCQHVAGDNNDYQVSLAQAQAVPYGTCTSAAGEDKVVNLVNYPSSFTAQVGTKILVKFTNANTKGHVSDNTSVDLTAGGVTKPIAAQGKTIGAGAIIAGGIYELTLTPDYWNIDQNVREVTSDYTILTDNTSVYSANQVNSAITNLFDNSTKVLKIGNLKIATGFLTVERATFTLSNGVYRFTHTSPIQFNTTFINNPKIIACACNDDDFMYCNVVGVIRSKTGIINMTMERAIGGTGLVNIAWVAIGE